jgi:hypothetical protein
MAIAEERRPSAFRGDFRAPSVSHNVGNVPPDACKRSIGVTGTLSEPPGEGNEYAATAGDTTVDHEEEASMALARVVTFEGVSRDRIEEMKREMEGGERPEGLPATELLVLHDPDAEQSLVIVFFDNEDDYRQGDEALNAMPAEDTPGRRASVTKYDVAHRMAV